jgi:hypothetical protein
MIEPRWKESRSPGFSFGVPLLLKPGDDVFDREELAVSHSRARRVFLCPVPGTFVFDHLGPERPSSALGRPGFVEPTDRFSGDLLSIEKDAIKTMNGVEFVQRPVSVDHPSVPNQKLGVLHPDMSRHRKAFVIIEPDGAFAARATIPATGALEPQAFLYPGGRVILILIISSFVLCHSIASLQ